MTSFYLSLQNMPWLKRMAGGRLAGGRLCVSQDKDLAKRLYPSPCQYYLLFQKLRKYPEFGIQLNVLNFRWYKFIVSDNLRFIFLLCLANVSLCYILDRYLKYLREQFAFQHLGAFYSPLHLHESNFNTLSSSFTTITSG